MNGEIQRKMPSTLYCQALLHSFIPESLTLSHSEQHTGNGSYGQLITVPVLSHTPCSSEVSALSCSFLQRISVCHSLGSCTGCSGVFILILILRGPQGTACFPSATPWAAGMSQLWHLKPFPPSFFTDPAVCGMIFHAFIFSSLHSLTGSAMKHFALSSVCFLKASPAALLELLAVASMGQPLAFPQRPALPFPLEYQHLDTNAQ